MSKSKRSNPATPPPTTTSRDQRDAMKATLERLSLVTPRLNALTEERISDLTETVAESLRVLRVLYDIANGTDSATGPAEEKREAKQSSKPDAVAQRFEYQTVTKRRDVRALAPARGARDGKGKW